MKIPGWFILIVIAILSGIIFWQYRNNNNVRELSKSNLKAARDSIKTYEIKIGGLNITVSEQNALVLTQKEAIEAGIIEREFLRKLHLTDVIAQATLKGRIKILEDSLALHPDVQIITIKDTSGIYHDYARIPFTLLDINTEQLILSAGMSKDKHPWYNLDVPFSGKLLLSYKRDGLFKSKYPVGIFSSENRNLSISQAEITIIQEKKSFLNSWWVHAAEGALIFKGIERLINK